jgi:all-trans-retinol 13,14-reductase
VYVCAVTRLSFKQSKPTGHWDAIVIGSGMGGLATAAVLSAHGRMRVCVLERHYTPGGFTHVFKRRGYEWDVGVHYIGGIDERGGVGALFDLVTGGRVKWSRMPEVYDRIILGDRSFDLVAGRANLIASLERDFPGSRATVEAYIALMRAAVKTAPRYFAGQLLPRAAKRLGSLMARKFYAYSDPTVEETLRPLVKDPLLYDVLTGQCGDYGLTPREASFAIHAMVALHYLEGAYYPVGGPATIADGAEAVIAGAGGEIYTNAEVSEILVEDGRAVGVRMVDGEELRARAIISDAGAPATYEKLLPRAVADKTGVPARLRAIGPSVAHLCLHLGFDETDEALGLDGTNLWIYPEGDREERFRAFAADPDAPIPVTYVSFPSSKDPTWATRHPGKATVEVITLARMHWFEHWAETRWMKRGEAYDDWKASMTDRLLETLYTQRPQLRGRIAHQELSTPLTTRHFTGHAAGEMYGLAHTPARFHADIRPQSDIPGLFLAGSDVATCGVAGALSGGLMAAGAVLKGDLPGILKRRFQDAERGVG